MGRMGEQSEAFLRGRFVALTFRDGQRLPVPVTYEVYVEDGERRVRFLEIKAPSEELDRAFEQRSVRAALERQVLLHVEELMRAREAEGQDGQPGGQPSP